MEDFGRFWKSQWVELRLDTERDGWLSVARKAMWRVPHEMLGRWKSRDRMIVPLTPYVEKSLNSEVIKSFVPEQRSRYVFIVFRDSYVLCYIYIYIYIYIYMNIICPFQTWPYRAMVQGPWILRPTLQPFRNTCNNSECFINWSYLTTPPLGQDMTQAEFNRFEFRVVLLLD